MSLINLEVAAKIIDQGLVANVERLRLILPEEGDIEGDISHRIEKACKNLSLFRNVIEHIPDCLELQIMQLNPDPDLRRRKKGRFKKSARGNFIKKVAREEKPNLKKMGLPDQAIAFMEEEGKIPPCNSGEDKYDVSVDHIFDLDADVDDVNGYENLCLMPTFLNQAKGRFKGLQVASGLSVLRVQFMPRQIDGKFPRVPIIPSGFRPFKNGQENAARLNDLFGCNLL